MDFMGVPTTLKDTHGVKTTGETTISVKKNFFFSRYNIFKLIIMQ